LGIAGSEWFRSATKRGTSPQAARDATRKGSPIPREFARIGFMMFGGTLETC
jgi:hypothetical protein